VRESKDIECHAWCLLVRARHALLTSACHVPQSQCNRALRNIHFHNRIYLLPATRVLLRHLMLAILDSRLTGNPTEKCMKRIIGTHPAPVYFIFFCLVRKYSAVSAVFTSQYCCFGLALEFITSDNSSTSDFREILQETFLAFVVSRDKTLKVNCFACCFLRLYKCLVEMYYELFYFENYSLFLRFAVPLKRIFN
jgi:hypothetical protein